ncbi:transglutaminase-like domain-containing protein [Yoonia sediminilitoris]|uniref:Transglutaminase superfamily protein n=1 Tax=Yoonia sediminilitoris TaxID=1286148 RepID=A0A2T6K9S1_9RHOB|nr:transglutaminase family protein [Yoonia sediminilitoris]PUB11576.1 transglutaminase superfamily protein [Yoonia sediminilitoris]RCW91776.1 transglutaminase superfamily protein [Yoonia sediminilitoris]
MKLHIHSHLVYRLKQPCPLLLQIEVSNAQGQDVCQTNLDVQHATAVRQLDDESGQGRRVWIDAAGDFTCEYHATVAITRPAVALSSLQQSPLTSLGADEVRYLMPSRYCHPERFFDFTAQNFSGLRGGARIAAMSAWIKDNMRYDIFASNAGTDAFDTFQKRAGVCRDFAHLLIAMSRAVSIPARFVSCYGPNVSPQDFHAVTEVYLDGAWHLVDPTGMSDAQDIARIGVGRDAADVSFLTSFGWVDLVTQSVAVTQDSA